MLWLVALSALTCARAEIRSGAEDVSGLEPTFSRHPGSDMGGCWYMGRWYAAGAMVRVRDACLRCRCAHGALSCARAACAPAPDPPPRHCTLLHRRDACCPELHCPDEVRSLELEATSRAEEEGSVATPAAAAHACVSAGAVFAAGSALGGGRACERCWCLGGTARCVRPRCLPPPAGCAPRPAPGVCCPDRYYCHNNTTTTAGPPSSTPATTHHPHDCLVNGSWIPEGERVPRGACASCFCLRGAVRCQPQHCAPALLGCTPLLREGHCCPHQYRCPHHSAGGESVIESISDNALVSTRYEERSLSATAPAARASPAPPAPTPRSSPSTSQSTTKVKRKTNDPPPANVTHDAKPNKTETMNTLTTTETSKKESSDTKSPSVATSTIPSTMTTTVSSSEKPSTEQPEGSVRVIINGTINCTAELSSARNTTLNDTATTSAADRREGIAGESEAEGEGDIITQRPLEDGDSFTINVTSSLFSNKSLAVAPSPAPAPTASTTQLVEETNISKSVKDDYDYDYTEPTLPPSLPNLKIIPFVAADAVPVEDEASSASESYPAVEDQFPVYYPETAVPTASRRQDVFPSPLHYPVFPSPPPPTVPPAQPVSSPTTTSIREQPVTTPSVNLFSPPVETEGGFIPKGPGLIEEYYAVYPSTPPPTPHLTTSMQINPQPPDNGECVTPDGRRVPEGESVWVSCAVCACAWGELACAPRPCPTPARCRRRKPTASDICCGELVCDEDNSTTALPTLPSRGTEITLNVSKVPAQLESERIPFEPPPDRSPPPAPAPPASTTSPPRTSTPATLETTGGHTSTEQDDALPAPALPVDDNNLNATSDKSLPEDQHSITNTTEKLDTVSTAVTPSASHTQQNITESPVSQEYEEEDEDEGFSFGSVLKLLLSDSYHSTTSSTTAKTPSTTTTVRSPPFPTSKKPASKLPLVPFVPIPQYPLYSPSKKVPQPTAVNRIDHLVLGEATAIKRTTPRPATTPTRPSTPVRRFTLRTTTRRPSTTARPVTRTEEPATSLPVVESVQSVGGAGGAGAGLLKLAGCNIYGRMYRVGRIIAELSTPCQECRCTELGVQCAPLAC